MNVSWKILKSKCLSDKQKTIYIFSHILATNDIENVTINSNCVLLECEKRDKSQAANSVINLDEKAATGTTRLDGDEHFMSLAAEISTNIGEKVAKGTTRLDRDERDKSLAANIATNIDENASIGTTRLERDDVSLAADIATNIDENAATVTTRFEPDEHLMSLAANIDENEATRTTRLELDDVSFAADIATNIGENAAIGTTRFERDEHNNNDQTDLIVTINESELENNCENCENIGENISKKIFNFSRILAAKDSNKPVMSLEKKRSTTSS